MLTYDKHKSKRKRRPALTSDEDSETQSQSCTSGNSKLGHRKSVSQSTALLDDQPVHLLHADLSEEIEEDTLDANDHNDIDELDDWNGEKDSGMLSYA